MIIIWDTKKSNPFQSYGIGTVFNGLSGSGLAGRGSCIIVRGIKLNKGDKIKMQARVFIGSTSAETAGDTIRFRVRKIPKP